MNTPQYRVCIQPTHIYGITREPFCANATDEFMAKFLANSIQVSAPELMPEMQGRNRSRRWLPIMRSWWRQALNTEQEEAHGR